jgi:hypothetical protein
MMITLTLLMRMMILNQASVSDLILTVPERRKYKTAKEAKQSRQEKNRRSAKESRKRKKDYVSSLEMKI